MAEQLFKIEERLPGLNELINANRINKFKGAKLKKDIQERICWAIKLKSLKPVNNPCTLNFEWHERTYKRDLDNIASAKKFILDALQEMKILQNDNQKWVKGFKDIFVKDTSDFVKITIIEI